MKIENKTILITGANRGIGRALVEEALRLGAKRVYAGTRGTLAHTDPRVTPLQLDVTDSEQIRQAVAQIEAAAGKPGAAGHSVDALDILVNNAGVAHYDDLSDRSMLDRHLAVNFFGIYDLVQAFLPALTRSRGAIVNNLSMVALAPFPPIASYSVSKAAAFSLTQSLRALLAGKGVTVHAILTGPVDTDINRGLDIPKASPESAARAIFAGVEQGAEDIFPDPASASLAESWNSSAMKAMERQNAAFIATQPA